MTTRRTYLRTAAAVFVGGLAGCAGRGQDGAGASDGGADSTPNEDRSRTASRSRDDTGTATTTADTPIPTADRPLYVHYDREMLRGNVLSGGPPKDGIPSIDEPQFQPADDADLADGAPVFGLVRNGVVRAYPQYILVHHEIVNDVVGGENVAVTYCPLTGTAQGFERGSVEFGVSGKLLNSNLVMYDRHGDSRWPQMLATAISGPMAGATLREFQLLWTTWGRWRRAHPDTAILTEDTGYVRRYGNDPYGEYNPPRGYYANDRTLFAPLERDDRASPKTVVIGARTEDGAIAFDKQALLDAAVQTGSIDDAAFVAVADPTLQTGYVYANPEGKPVESAGDGRYTVEGDTVAASNLPLDRVLAFDAMWFAWAGYYPETTYVE